MPGVFMLLALLLSGAATRRVSTPSPVMVNNSALRCPIELWRGPCGYMTTEQRNQVRVAVKTHFKSDDSALCLAARDAVMAWVEDGTQAWVFASHVRDRSADASLVLGQTAHLRGRPAGFGIRHAVFSYADSRTLARVALHEGAHLSGADEADAREVDSLCTL